VSNSDFSLWVLGDLVLQMASTGRSMLLSLLLFAVTLSLLEMYRGWFASSELKTIAGGFVSSLLFLLLLTVRHPPFPLSSSSSSSSYCGGGEASVNARLAGSLLNSSDAGGRNLGSFCCVFRL
jgi:hypothetical protein